MKNTKTENTADAIRYTVRFDRNGGTGTAPRTLEADAGENITLPGSGTGMMKANHVFAGWLASPAGTEEAMRQGSKYAPTSDVTLYAQWIAREDMAPVAITVAGFESDDRTIGLFVMDEAGERITVSGGNERADSADGKAVFSGLKFSAGNCQIVLRYGYFVEKREWRSRGLLAVNSGGNGFDLATHFTETKITKITVSGITVADADNAEITIRRGMRKIAFGDSVTTGIEAGNTVVALTDERDRFAFSGGGIFEIVLELRQSNGTSGMYRIESRNLNAGTTNAVPFGEFAEMPALAITVSGISATYSGAAGCLWLHLPETDDGADAYNNAIDIPDTVFSVSGAPAGIYDVLLSLHGDNGAEEILMLDSRKVGERTRLEFSGFTSFAAMPATRITVTGLESFDGLRAEITLGNDAADGRCGKIHSGEAIFTLIDFKTMLPFNRGGSFRLELSVAGERWEITETLVPDGDNRFDFADFGGKPTTVLIVTDVPDSMLFPVAGNLRVLSGTKEIALGNVSINRGLDLASCVLKKPDGENFYEKGTFPLELEFLNSDGLVKIRSSLASKSLAAGTNVIPFSDFAVVFPIAITVDDIDLAGVHRAEIAVIKDGNKVASADCYELNKPALFFLESSRKEGGFNTPGTYRLGLTLKNEQWATLGVYYIASKPLTAGANAVSFAEFTPAMSIAVDGINVSGAFRADLFIGENITGPDNEYLIIGMFEKERLCGTEVEGSRAFFLPGLLDESPALAESYRLMLKISNIQWEKGERYLIPAKALTTGANVIQLAEFIIEINILVEGIDVAGAFEAEIFIEKDGRNVFRSFDDLIDSKKICCFPKTENGGSFPTGTYDLELYLKDERGLYLGKYRIASKALVPGTNIVRLGDFARIGI